MLTRRGLELAAAAVIIALGAVAIAGALEHDTGWASDGPQSGYFPFRLGIILCAAGALIAAQALLSGERGSAVVLSRESAGRMARFFLPIVFYVGIAQLLGLYVATGLYLAFMTGVVARHRPATVLAVSLVVPSASWVLFELWFTVPLKKGPLEAWLGLA